MRMWSIRFFLCVALKAAYALRNPYTNNDQIPHSGQLLSKYDVPTPAPIIGILSQPGFKGMNATYLVASYVKLVEGAGARAVPILSDWPKDTISAMFKKLNGLIVPGGAQNLRPGEEFYDAVSLLTDLAMKSNDEENDPFPIMYVCLGLEAAAVKFTDNPDILSNFTGAIQVTSELTWTEAADSASALELVPMAVRKMAAEGGLAYEVHNFGVWLPDFWGSKLSEAFNLLSTSRDALGKVYVSTMQAKKYPFIATQWHPNSNLFEFQSDTIPHSLPAKLLSQALANTFVNWAQRSTHSFDSPEDRNACLIYNYSPVMDTHGFVDQVYLLPLSSPPCTG